MASFGLKDVEDAITKSDDPFDNRITLNTRNVADIASHYPFSPERYRVFIDGTRQFIQYDGFPTQYEDTIDSYLIKPQADGETVHIETTERYRYVVGFTIEASTALQINQAPQAGDIIVWSYGEPDTENSTGAEFGPSADGYFMYWDESTGVDQVGLAIYRDGTELANEVVDMHRPVTDFTRFEIKFSWYNVGKARFIQTYTDQGNQFNKTLGEISVDGDKGPTSGNKSLKWHVKTGSAGAGSLELEQGSTGLRLLGDTNPNKRRKTIPVTATINTTDTFVPFYAFRQQNSGPKENVTLEVSDVRIPDYGGNGDVIVLAQAFDITNLRDANGNAIEDADFSVPNAVSDQNSAIEETFAIDQFPDSTGTIVTSAADPGGYQEGYGANYVGKSATSQATGAQQRRLISERDVVTFLAKAEATGELDMEYDTEQQW